MVDVLGIRNQGIWLLNPRNGVLSRQMQDPAPGDCQTEEYEDLYAR